VAGGVPPGSGMAACGVLGLKTWGWGAWRGLFPPHAAVSSWSQVVKWSPASVILRK
jgi:hypothetical protein